MQSRMAANNDCSEMQLECSTSIELRVLASHNALADGDIVKPLGRCLAVALTLTSGWQLTDGVSHTRRSGT